MAEEVMVISKRNILFLFFVMLGSLSGCSRPVGGPCEFESRIGVAKIVAIEEGETLATFDPMDAPFTTDLVPFSATTQFAVTELPSGRTGTIYPAQLEIMTKGACTPYHLSLLATEHMSQGLFIGFDQTGKALAEASQTVKQIAATFKKLQVQWPQLALSLCGQTDTEGSAEYNLNLAQHYISIISNQLIEAGVPTSRIEPLASGEDSCPGRQILSGAGENGIWINFHLVPDASRTNADRDTFEKLLKQAKQGDKTAQFYLANFYAGGKGVERDFDQAFYWFQKAAEQGVCQAQLLVGLSYLAGIGTQKDTTKGADWFERAAKGGSAEAAYQLGMAYLQGQGREKDKNKGIEYLRDATRGGNQNALAYFLEAANNNDTTAQLFLAAIYAYGAGVPQDNEEAMSWYQRAAEAGNSDAMFLLGQAYHDGDLTTKNPQKALFWYRKAAAEGNSSAWYRLGSLYEIGELVPKDKEKAISWYRKAAEAGFYDAETILNELTQEK